MCAYTMHVKELKREEENGWTLNYFVPLNVELIVKNIL